MGLDGLNTMRPDEVSLKISGSCMSLFKVMSTASSLDCSATLYWKILSQSRSLGTSENSYEHLNFSNRSHSILVILMSPGSSGVIFSWMNWSSLPEKRKSYAWAEYLTPSPTNLRLLTATSVSKAFVILNFTVIGWPTKTFLTFLRTKA